MAASRKPSAPIVELQPETYQRLQRVAEDQHRAMGEIVTELLERYEDDTFWEEVNESVNRLRSDPEAWRDYQEEIAFFEGGPAHGLQDDPYFTPEEEEEIRAAARAEGG